MSDSKESQRYCVHYTIHGEDGEPKKTYRWVFVGREAMLRHMATCPVVFQVERRYHAGKLAEFLGSPSSA